MAKKNYFNFECIFELQSIKKKKIFHIIIKSAFASYLMNGKEKNGFAAIYF